MKHRSYYLTLLLFASQYSCTLSEKEQLKQLEERVLHQHDEAMRRMDQLNQLQNTLRTYLKQADTVQIETQLLRKQLADLSQADAAMMDWMHQYQSPDSLSAAKATVYLQAQLVKIEQVKSRLDSALTRAAKTKKRYETTHKR